MCVATYVVHKSQLNINFMSITPNHTTSKLAPLANYHKHLQQ